MDIRPSPLAGRWYPGDPRQLADTVDSYIMNAPLPDLSGQVIALISPHAGHLYSGPVAGYAFHALQGSRPDLVVILSPYHQHHPAALLTTGHEAYQTPLGNVAVDQLALRKISTQLKAAAGVELTEVRNDGEHAVEILLPFFQRTLPDGFRIAPLMVRDQDPGLMKALGHILTELASEENLLLTASTDLSHFHPASQARQLDQTIMNCIMDLDPEGLYSAHQDGTGSACGLGPLAAVIWGATASGDVTSHMLQYANSGDVTGDNSSVVGYASAVLTRD